MSRFDYIKYDDVAVGDQNEAKKSCQRLEADIEVMITSPQAKSLALTKLEECYMWIGKAIRDDQIARNGSAPLQEERNDDSLTMVTDTFKQEELPF